MINRTIKILAASIAILIASIACEQENENLFQNTGQNSNDTGTITEDTNAVKITITDILANNCANHEDYRDYQWESNTAIQISLRENSITANSSDVVIDGTVAKIVSAGTYSISGSLNDGQLIVDTDDTETVKLILNGVAMNNSTSAPVYIANAEKTVLILAENSHNYLSDGSSYTYENTEEDEPNATLFSKDDLSICGEGTLSITANYNDAISSKDGLIIQNGNIEINAADDGIRGKDYLIIEGGSISIAAQGDGLKSDNQDDADKGYIYIENGTISISASGDAISAQTDALLAEGDISISTEEGIVSLEEVSAKGIKAGITVLIDQADISLSTRDDALHSNNLLAINGGNITITSGDDGIHADTTLGIYGGNITIKESFEGIESRTIRINSGSIYIKSSDDGINVAGGNDGSAMPGWPGGPGSVASTSDYYLFINGGHSVVQSDGDGIDVNGTIVMTGGDVIVNGPTTNNNGALDFDGSCKITGGLLVAAGSSGMVQAPGTQSTQYSVLINMDKAREAATLFHIESSAGNELLTFKPAKRYQSVVFSSPNLGKASYSIYLGGSSDGTPEDGLYTDGTYSPGSKYAEFSISGIVTTMR